MVRKKNKKNIIFSNIANRFVRILCFLSSIYALSSILLMSFSYLDNDLKMTLKSDKHPYVTINLQYLQYYKKQKNISLKYYKMYHNYAYTTSILSFAVKVFFTI